MVLIITNVRVSGMGVSWHKKGTKDAFVLWQKPVITVPARRGKSILRFTESCVVGVNECGRRPNRFGESASKQVIRLRIRPVLYHRE